MEKLETIEEWKPNKTTNFLLFVLFCLLICRVWDWIKYWKDYGFEYILDYEKYPLSFTWIPICTWIAIIAGDIMSFKTITLVLGGNRECVFSMRLCLIHIIITQTLISPYWHSIVPMALTNLYLLFFLGYMLFAKSIKEHFPKDERRIRFWGSVWIVLIIMYLIPILSSLKYLRSSSSANPTYQYKEQNDFENDDYYLNRVDSCKNSIILAGQYTIDNTRSHNLILYDLLEGLKKDSVNEVSISDTLINDKRIITTILNINQKDVYLSTVFDPGSQNMVAIISKGDNPDSIINAIDFKLKEGIFKNGIEEIQDTEYQ